MGAKSTKQRIEEILASRGEVLEGAAFTDTSEGVFVEGEIPLDSEEGSLLGIIRFAREPSEDTKQALEYAVQFENSSLEEIYSALREMQGRRESKFKNQCLILLRNLYLVKSKPPVLVRAEDSGLIRSKPPVLVRAEDSDLIRSKPPVLVRAEDNELIPLPPPGTWGLALG